MNLGILTIGNELTSGKTQDTNASFIARTVHRQGWRVAAILSVGDDSAAIAGALAYLFGVADALVVTGGLGPTADDITTEAIARALGLPLVTDEEVLEHVKRRMTSRNRTWTENNAKQARFPRGAEPVVNRIGTAWGFVIRQEGKVVSVIPGVPPEAEKMFSEGVMPILRREYAATTHVATRIIKLSGISESAVDQALAPVAFESFGVEIGFYPRFPELEIVLTARDMDGEAALSKVGRAEGEVRSRFPDHIFGCDKETLEELVAALLREKRKTIALAESCTGGLIADRLTDVPGSSAFFERGLVTYSNPSKVELLGVPARILERHGAVSEKAARMMAEGARERAGTDLGLSVTGIAGPAGGTADKPVGTVFIALADGENTLCRHYLLSWERRRIKVLASQLALMMTKRYLAGL